MFLLTGGIWSVRGYEGLSPRSKRPVLTVTYLGWNSKLFVIIQLYLTFPGTQNEPVSIEMFLYLLDAGNWRFTTPFLCRYRITSTNGKSRINLPGGLLQFCVLLPLCVCIGLFIRFCVCLVFCVLVAVLPIGPALFYSLLLYLT